MDCSEPAFLPETYVDIVEALSDTEQYSRRDTYPGLDPRSLMSIASAPPLRRSAAPPLRRFSRDSRTVRCHTDRL
jgi:hypothetical protein